MKSTVKGREPQTRGSPKPLSRKHGGRRAQGGQKGGKSSRPILALCTYRRKKTIRCWSYQNVVLLEEKKQRTTQEIRGTRKKGRRKLGKKEQREPVDRPSREKGLGPRKGDFFAGRPLNGGGGGSPSEGGGSPFNDFALHKKKSKLPPFHSKPRQKKQFSCVKNKVRSFKRLRLLQKQG